MLVQILIIRPMWKRKAPLFAIILATLAVQLLIEQIIILTMGDQPRTYPGFSPGGPLKLGSIAIGYQLFWISRLRRADGAAAHAFLQSHPRRARVARLFAEPRRSRGLARHSGQRHADAVVRARAQRSARRPASWITPTQYTAWSVDGPFGINGFIAAIIGGFGSAPAALAGGILLGVVQLAPPSWWSAPATRTSWR